jgi:hypothetical protein
VQISIHTHQLVVKTASRSNTREIAMASNGKEKYLGPAWPTEAPYDDHMSKPFKGQERPFSEQATLAPITSVPPQYGNEHEAARDGAIAQSEHIEDVDKSNLVDPNTRNTRGQRLKRHCMRYWICYVLLNIILLAILLPIL